MILEFNNIYNMDSLEGMKQLPDESVDLVITSPPYSDVKTYIDFKGIHPDEYVDWFMPYIKEIERVLKPTGNFILNVNDKVVNRFRHPYVYDLVSRLHKETGLKMFERLYWDKKKSLPNRGRFSDRVEFLFWFSKTKKFKLNMDEMRVPYAEKSIQRMKKPLKKRFARGENDDDLGYKNWSPNEKGALPSSLIQISSQSTKVMDKHVAVYPKELVEYFLLGASDKGDVVLDPFMGTGTTGVVAKENGRQWIGFDINEEYVDFANDRIDNNTIVKSDDVTPIDSSDSV